MVLHKPPTKAGGQTSIGKHPATAKSGVESAVSVEPVPKTGSAIVEQTGVKSEGVSPADPPKAKAEITQQPESKAQPDMIVQQESPKVGVDTAVQQRPTPKEESRAVEKANPPKPESQPQSLLSLAGIKGVLGLGPSKSEKPPPVLQGDDRTQIEKDEEADI